MFVDIEMSIMLSMILQLDIVVEQHSCYVLKTNNLNIRVILVPLHRHKTALHFFQSQYHFCYLFAWQKSYLQRIVFSILHCIENRIWLSEAQRCLAVGVEVQHSQKLL